MSPDGSTKPLPEEKLLNLIREKGTPSAAASASSQTTGVAVVMIANKDAKTHGGQPQWIQLAIGGLSVLLLIEVVSLVVQVTRPVPTVAIPRVTSTPSSESAHAIVAPAEIPSLAASASRPLFAVSADLNPVTTMAAPKAGPSDSAKQLAVRLTLMGIIAGNPAQAIIEDSQTKKTYFVSTGQVVVEGAVLKEVLDNRVVLDLQGERVELSL